MAGETIRGRRCIMKSDLGHGEEVELVLGLASMSGISGWEDQGNGHQY